MGHISGTPIDLATPHDQVPEQLFGDGSYFRDRPVKDCGVGPGRLTESADLAYVLQRGGLDFFFGSRPLGISEGLDASTHGAKLAQAMHNRPGPGSPPVRRQGLASKVNTSRDAMTFEDTAVCATGRDRIRNVTTSFAAT
jgi:hypothetical protein